MRCVDDGVLGLCESYNGLDKALHWFLDLSIINVATEFLNDSFVLGYFEESFRA